VFVQKSQLGGGSPKLRGFAANGVLLVVDGVRMNNAIFRSGNLQNVINIDPNAIESTEVIFGPGSVIYGSDALGGVLDFHTIDPKWSSDNKFDANLISRYSTAAKEITNHIDFSFASPKVTFFQSISLSDFGDLRAGSNRSTRYRGEFERRFFVSRVNGEDKLIQNDDINLQKSSGYSLFNSISKVKVRLGKEMNINYAYYYSNTSDIPRYDNLTINIPNTDSLQSAEWYYGPQNWQMHNVRFNHYKATPIYDQLRITTAYQRFEESRNDRRFGDDQLRTRTENVDLISLSIDLDKQIENNELYYGFDFYHNDVASSAQLRNILSGELSNTTTRYPNGGSKLSSIATYISYIHEINNKFSSNIGFRYNKIDLTANSLDANTFNLGANSIEESNEALTGSLGLIYKIGKSKLSYNIASGFRAPNVDDISKLFEVNEKVTIVPNPELKPEKTISNEVSFQYKTDKSLFTTTLFYSRSNDAIVRNNLLVDNEAIRLDNGSFASTQVNTGKAQIYGGSILAQIEISNNLAVKSLLNYTDGEDISNGQPLRHTPPLFGKSSVIYRKNNLRTEFYIVYNGNKNASDIPNSEFIDKPYLYTSTGSPGWYTLNLIGSYQASDHIEISGGIENIMDQHYRPYTSGISAPGRNLIISIRGNI